MKRALVVIDVQNEYVTGNLPIGYPRPEESLRNIGDAVDAANEAGIPVVFVRHAAPEGSPIFARGSTGCALHDAVVGKDHDHDVEKTLPSAFTGTDLADWLKSHDIDTVVIAGYMTQNCDESTARDAAHRGYAVEFLSDATGTLALENHAGALTAEQLHTSVLVVLQSAFASVATTQEWIESVRAGTGLEPPNIVASTEAGRSAAAGDTART